MVKKTKRTRKFESKGGIKAKLQKGTITNKGKIKRKQHSKDDGLSSSSRNGRNNFSEGYLEEIKRKKEEGDMLSEKNLGELDMETFFTAFADNIDNDQDLDDNDKMENMEGQDDDDDDDDNEAEKNTDTMTNKKGKKSKDQKESSTKDDDHPTKKRKLADGKSTTPNGKKADMEKDKKKSKKDKKKTSTEQTDSKNDSDSEEEDVEAAEKNMKEQMSKLQRTDPDFHQFLKENEESLLEYGDDDDDDDDEEDMDDDDVVIDDDMVDDDEDDDDDAVETGGDGINETDENQTTADDSTIDLTPSLLSSLEKGAFEQRNVKLLKKWVHAFKSACHLTDSEQDDTNDGNNQGGGGSQKMKYHIESSQVFDRLMVLSLTKLPQLFHYHLFGRGSKGQKNEEKQSKKDDDDDDNKKKKRKKNDSSEEDRSTVKEEKKEEDDDAEESTDPNKPIPPKLMEKSKRWVEVKSILFIFFKSTMHILSEAKDTDLVVFILKSLADSVPYMSSFPRLAESMMKTLTTLWSAPIDASEDYQVVRLHSFLRIRQLAITQPFPFIEESLKKVYLAYAKRAKFATSSSVTSALPTLTFMGNCVVELYSLDYHSSYQHAFIYIRQLALHLRTAMQKKTPEAMGAVYCWQYVHCLKLWVAVLSEACNSSNEMTMTSAVGASGEDQLLKSLIFPLTQVILGTVRLIPSTRYLPLRLHCVRLLQQLAAASKMFIPTTSILLDVFDLRELNQSPKRQNKRGGSGGGGGGTTHPLALTLRLRADSPLRTMDEQEMCIVEVFVLLGREVDLYQYSAAFPEFSVRICQRLRKFSKETRNSKWRAYAKGCLDICDRYSSRAIEERANKLTDIAPKDARQLEMLKPVNVPNMGERYRQSIEQERRLEAATRPVVKTGSNGKNNKSGPNADEDDAATAESKNKSKKQQKKKKKKKGEVESPGPDDEIENPMDLEDEVEDGINWSDDDED